jgi:hypothetical protein
MSGIHLHVTTEGQTEQAFILKVLAPHLAQFNVYADARCILTSKDKHAGKQYRGGLPNYQKAKVDIQTWLKEDQRADCRFTTMFDLYALPNDFPDYEKASRCTDPYQQIKLLEVALAHDIGDSRFMPYLQLHEFEALILADATKLDWEYLEHESAIANLVAMVAKVSAGNPELINQGAATAPSKRILKEIPEYDKVTAGWAVVEQIGLDTLRKACPHFNEWLTRLEQLGATGE